LASPELGAKQICPNCSAKFYDLTRRPAHCPICATEFDPEEAVKSRRGRSRPANYDDDETPAPVEKEVEGFEDEVDETPELDKVIEEEVVEPDDEAEIDPGEAAGKPAAADGDLGVDFATEDDLEDAADEDDVPFLEDDDDDFDEDDIEGLPGEDDRD
jgi:uncharacterized protein (TIGR02300 family)